VTAREVTLRRAVPADAEAVASVYLESFHGAYRFPLAHTDDEVRDWIRDVVIPARETWAAVAAGAAVGMLVLDGAEVDQLYVAPGWTGHGIGSRLLELAKQLRPGGLALYTFQVNRGARRFYERHGFVLVDESDGSRSEERQPDVRYAWPGA
jgi:GNAT superfamily N-acetyltransferase